MSWLKKLRRVKNHVADAGWECLVCGHREYCTWKRTFWLDVGRTLFVHRNQHHSEGHDYAMHIPTGWEREKEKKS